MFISTFYDIQNIISKSATHFKAEAEQTKPKNTRKSLFKNQTVLLYTFKYRSQSLFYYIDQIYVCIRT